MYLGRLVELATATALYADPQMPYTQALLSAIPDRTGGKRQRIVLTGDVPSPLDPPSGCPFRTRCWRAEARCEQEVPALREVRPEHSGRLPFPRCWLTTAGVTERNCMRVNDCNWMMLEEYLEHDDRVVLPIGSTEQHGYLSVGTDAILAERVSVEAAEPLGVPVMPVLPYGLAPYFAAFPGSMTVRASTYLALIRDLLDSLATQGFRRIAGSSTGTVATSRPSLWSASGSPRTARSGSRCCSTAGTARPARLPRRCGSSRASRTAPGSRTSRGPGSRAWYRPPGSKPVIPNEIIVQSTPQEIRD